MAFGDKPTWFNTDTSILTEGIDKSVDVFMPVAVKPTIEMVGRAALAWDKPIIDSVPIEATRLVVPLSNMKYVSCCFDPNNMAVDPDRIFCLKCRKTVTREHFNMILGC